MTEKRDQIVNLRLTADELDRIDAQAEREKRDRSGLIRWVLSQYLEREN